MMYIIQLLIVVQYLCSKLHININILKLGFYHGHCVDQKETSTLSHIFCSILGENCDRLSAFISLVARFKVYSSIVFEGNLSFRVANL